MGWIPEVREAIRHQIICWPVRARRPWLAVASQGRGDRRAAGRAMPAE